MVTPAGRFKFGSYWLLRRLAKGGMAEIYLASPAKQGHENERLVIKRLLPQFSQEEEFLRMFLQEARLASQLAHPNIVRILDLGLEGGHLYIAMEYIDGYDLETLTRGRRRWLSPPLAARIAIELLSALAYAHQATDLQGQPMRVVHRDVTPENVMITRQGGLKLVDFGVAKATAHLSMTRPGVVKGKISYMAPEHIQGVELDGRADLFSLGATLYELTTGFKPFERAVLTDTMAAILREEPPPLDEVAPNYPPALAKVIMRALAKDRDRRYAGAREMKADLERYLDSTQRILGPADLMALVEGVPDDPPLRGPAPIPVPPAPRAAPPPTQAPPRGELLESDFAHVNLDGDDDDDAGPKTIPGSPSADEILKTAPPKRSQQLPPVDPQVREPTVEYELKKPAPRLGASPDDFVPLELGDGEESTTSTAVSGVARAPAARPLALRIFTSLVKGLILGGMLIGSAWLGRMSALREVRPRLASLQDELAEAKETLAALQVDAGAAAAISDGGTASTGGDAGIAAAATSSQADAGARNGQGRIVIEGKISVLIDDKPCHGPCAVWVPAGEHVVKVPGRKKIEKKVVVAPGEKQVVKVP